MPIADKYRLHRQIGWSDAAEVHAGPLDPAHKVPVAVKIRHGIGGEARPDGNRDRFLRAANEQAAAALGGCRGIAPVFEAGQEGNDAFYVTKLYPRSLDSLIQGRVALDAAALHRLTDGVLRVLEELRDKQGRAHGNLKPTNIFIDGKSVQSAPLVVSDLALADQAKSQAVDCCALGATLYQLLRSRAVRRLDWPMEHSEDWARLGPSADAWRRFCNVLISPDLGLQAAPLADVRMAFKKMKARANDAPSLRGAGALGGSGSGTGSGLAKSRHGSKGLLAGLATTVAALAAGAALFLTQAGQKITDRWKGVSGKVNAVSTLTPALGGLIKTLPNGGGSPSPAPGQPPASNDLNGPAAGSPAPDAPPGATPLIAEATPPPTPAPTPTPYTSAGDKWIGYTALLQRFKDTLGDPNSLEQPELLNGTLTTFKENVGFLPVSSEVSVGDFLRRLPPKLEATGDQPDLPANLWTKGATAKLEDMQTVVYQWGKTDLRMQFNRVVPPGGNGPAFYLSATTVPVRFGVILAQLSEGTGKLRGVTGLKGPVAWQYANGAYGLRPAWINADSFNPFYANTGRPTADCPMNGLSGMEAMQLARAAGCTLPTLKQWGAVLNSPAGQEWSAQWQTIAKVRSPEWSAFAKGIQAKRATGSVLPNDQCFGDRLDLSAVTTVSDPNYFFEPVNGRERRGFAHLIGNVGQYVVDDARAPTKYYFAGGSAVSAPATFQNLPNPPAATTPFATSDDAGFRLAAPARGNGSEKNPALDKLKVDLDAELARAQKLQ